MVCLQRGVLITKTIRRGKVGTRDIGACIVVLPITSVPITSIYCLTFSCLFDHSVCTCGHPMDALRTYFLRPSHVGERIAAHDVVRDASYHIIREAGHVVVRGKTGFLPSSIPGGRGGRVDLVISEPTRGHTLLYVVIAN